MDKIEKLNLIEGEFTHEDAKEVLMNIFSTKVNFHKIKNFSSKERFGTVDEIAQKRIPELRKEIEKIGQIISHAKTKNRKLSIRSEIIVSLSED